MNILWLTNIPLPEVSLLMNEKSTPFGGWLINTSKIISNKSNLSLSIAFPKKGRKSVGILQGEKNMYYSFPTINNNNRALISNNKYLEEIVEKSKPDIVHIFGTEFAHTLAMVNICKRKNVKAVISIQGLVSVIAQHYVVGLPDKVKSRFTFRDLVKRDNIKQQQIKFSKRGEYEIRAIEKVEHVIGRTTWDKACTLQINPNIQYHHCNESLRDEFYHHEWDIERCERQSIFLSQGSYPVKGLHFMIEAMRLVVKRYPKAKLYVGGTNITLTESFKEKLKLSSYGRYVKELIQKNGLQNNVTFTGVLDEKEMCERFLKSNVFVSSSTIENSPNSLGEAMLLGVPCIASNVGGVADLLTHQEEGFVYQSDAPYMLAYYIINIFSDKKLAVVLSDNSETRAMKTHNKMEVANRVMEIYKYII